MNEGITQQEIKHLLDMIEKYLRGDVSLTTYSDGSIMLHRECVDMNESDDLMSFEDTLCSPEDAADVGLHALYAYLIIVQKIHFLYAETTVDGDKVNYGTHAKELQRKMGHVLGSLYVAQEALYMVIRPFLLENGVEFIAAYQNTDQSNTESD